MLYLPSSNCSEDGCSGYWYWGSSDGSTSTHEHMAKTIHNINIHANNSIDIGSNSQNYKGWTAGSITGKFRGVRARFWAEL